MPTVGGEDRTPPGIEQRFVLEQHRDGLDGIERGRAVRKQPRPTVEHGSQGRSTGRLALGADVAGDGPGSAVDGDGPVVGTRLSVGAHGPPR